MPGPWDPGLQIERTGLAWQRTMLSGLACCMLLSRLLADFSIPLATAIGLLALLGTAAVGWLSIRQFHRNSASLHASRPIGGALTPLLVSALFVTIAATAMAYVLLA